MAFKGIDAWCRGLHKDTVFACHLIPASTSPSHFVCVGLQAYKCKSILTEGTIFVFFISVTIISVSIMSVSLKMPKCVNPLRMTEATTCRYAIWQPSEECSVPLRVAQWLTRFLRGRQCFYLPCMNVFESALISLNGLLCCSYLYWVTISACFILFKCNKLRECIMHCVFEVLTELSH